MINLKRLKRDLKEIFEIGRVSSGGVLWPSFSDADHQARGWFLEKLAEANLQVNIDPVGNIFGRLEGYVPTVYVDLILIRLRTVECMMVLWDPFCI
jgi:acetylornithine deacetylase/succinyl-diaminopimelate desuccinylase-like protein